MATILIIDDTPSEIVLMKLAIQRLGHEVISAQNGKIGVQLAQQYLPALILLDIVMPEQDGFVTCRQIKKNELTAEIPVVLVSSKSTDSDRFWGLKQGATEYITKPFEPAQLAALVENLITL